MPDEARGSLVLGAMSRPTAELLKDDGLTAMRCIERVPSGVLAARVPSAHDLQDHLDGAKKPPSNQLLQLSTKESN